jgi:hypothetical protein
MRRQLLQHFPSLGDGEHRTLLRVAQNRNYEVLKNLRTSLDQVEVAVGRRIKGTGIDRKTLMQ